jgi:predicted Co/Zn/Cd cation transporter (cation efflux family)
MINHRLNWLIMTQTILFAAYGLLLGVQVENTESNFLTKIENLLDVLPAMGMSVSALVFLGILGAVGAMSRLKKRAKSQHVIIDAASWTSLLGQATGLLFPVVFLVGWLYILGTVKFEDFLFF